MVYGIRLRSLLAGFAALLAGSALASCSGKSGGANGAACADFGAVTGTVSFSKNVIPIFQRACNFDACHAATSSQPQEGLALGNNVMDGTMAAKDIATVHDDIVGKNSKRSTLHLVEASDPSRSWLVAKIRYEDFADCAAVSGSCTPKGCGGRMPQNNPPLSDADVNTIVAWVKGGAKND